MVGVAYNPNNCAFISNQARNANQFNGNVPYSTNNTNHLVLWDFVAEKLYWVNSVTNIIEAELPKGNSCDFTADINFSSQIRGVFTFICIPTNGVAPYTYDWSLEAAPKIDFAISGSSTSQTVLLTPSLSELQTIYLGLLKCVVTDAEGCKTTASFMPYLIVAL